MRKQVVVKDFYDFELKKTIKGIFVDNVFFDWAIDEEHLSAAKEMFGSNPNLMEKVFGDIKNYFLIAFSEFVGKKVSIKDVNEAIKNGYIEV